MKRKGGKKKEMKRKGKESKGKKREKQERELKVKHSKYSSGFHKNISRHVCTCIKTHNLDEILFTIATNRKINRGRTFS